VAEAILARSDTRSIAAYHLIAPPLLHALLHDVPGPVASIGRLVAQTGGPSARISTRLTTRPATIRPRKFVRVKICV
jgi:hypothetical protein